MCVSNDFVNNFSGCAASNMSTRSENEVEALRSTWIFSRCDANKSCWSYSTLSLLFEIRKLITKLHHQSDITTFHSFNLTCLPTCAFYVLASKHRRKFSSCYAAKWRWAKRRCCTILQLKSARRYFMALGNVAFLIPPNLFSRREKSFLHLHPAHV